MLLHKMQQVLGKVDSSNFYVLLFLSVKCPDYTRGVLIHMQRVLIASS